MVQKKMNKKVKDLCEKALKIYYNEVVNIQYNYLNTMHFEPCLKGACVRYSDFYQILFDLGLMSATERDTYMDEVKTAYTRVYVDNL